MTVLQESVATLQDIVNSVQHQSHNGGALGLYGDISVSTTTCMWQKPAKGCKERYLIFAFTGRGNTKRSWCGKEGTIVHKVRDGRAYLSTKGEPELMLLLPAFA